MAGEARTNAFLCGAATVMLGALGQVWALTPSANSMGLVKNVKVSTAPEYIKLETVKGGSPVYSVRGNDHCTATFEAFEYTGTNLCYSLGLDPASITPPQGPFTLSSPANPGDTTVYIQSPAYVQMDFPIGTWFSISEPSSDLVHVAQVSTLVTYTTANGMAITTLTFDKQPVPSGTKFSANAVVEAVSVIPIGSTAADMFVSAKIVGLMPDGDTPIGVMFPKVRVTKGFRLDLSGTQFSSMPFELTPVQPLPGDDDYDTFQGMLGRIFVPHDLQAIARQPYVPPIINQNQYIFLRNGARLVVRGNNPVSWRVS